MLLIIDNYDSFTYNLYQALAAMASSVEVVRNDAKGVEEIKEMAPEAIVLSPGPGKPAAAGICIPLIQALAPTTPILGVCLGHQAIVEAFGGEVVHAPETVHGRNCPIFHRQQGLFERLPLPLRGARYHSLMAHRNTLPDCLSVDADTAEGLVMAVSHKTYCCYGVQFHPESILTKQGNQLFAAFLKQAKKEVLTC